MPPEDTTPEGAGTPPVEPPEEDELVAKIKADPAKTAEEIRKLRKESRERKDRADKAERDQAAAESKRLEDEKQWEALARQRDDKVKELEPKASKLDEYQQFLDQQLERRLNALPQQWRDAVPEYDDPRRVLEWLDKNEAKFRLPALPNTGAGVQGDRGNVGKQPPPIDPAFMQMGINLHRTHEQIAKSWKEKLESEGKL